MAKKKIQEQKDPEDHLALLTAWLLSHAEQSGAHNYQKKVIAHRLLTDLISANGGTSEQQFEIMRKLHEV